MHTIENPGLNQPQDFETTFEMQQQCNDALDWTTVHLGIPDSRGLTLRSSGQLAPDSGCRFRLRGKNAAGFGPYSVVSELFRTLPDVPSPPRDLILSGQVKQATLVAQWQVCLRLYDRSIFESAILTRYSEYSIYSQRSNTYSQIFNNIEPRYSTIYSHIQIFKIYPGYGSFVCVDIHCCDRVEL